MFDIIFASQTTSQIYIIMTNLVNTSEKVKIRLTFAEIAKIRASLPANSIIRIGKECGLPPQMITNEFNLVRVASMSEDRSSRLIDRDIITIAIRLIKETGNTSFDHILNSKES